MTQIRQWLEAVRQGQLTLGQLVDQMNQRGSIEAQAHQLEMQDLDVLLKDNRIDPRLHRAVKGKLSDLQTGSIAPQAQGDADDKTVMASRTPPSTSQDDEDDGATVFAPESMLPAKGKVGAGENEVPATPAPAPTNPDDATRLATSPAPSEDDSAEQEATQMLLPGQFDDATRLVPDQKSDTSNTSSTTTSNTNQTGTRGSTGTGGTSGSKTWRRLAESEAPVESVDVGSRLKDRFLLEKKIGTGGMGVVFLAIDERKIEARDRDPKVAVKVLNDEFRRHPDSLIALQRESRRSQQLAHDNIVRVYDFDKDGSIVFMTMEYVDGDDLKDMIRGLGGKRMAPEAAFPIIEGMGRGLARAHRDGVVHSDFKPGNVMLTKDLVPKVFDFGIARAGKHRADASGEQTVFDAGSLGALTPAYASLEMLQGKDAEPADDIYALACVAYELLGGRHPFDKVNAEQAQKQGIVPLRIPGLSTLQWKTLSRGLAFRREDRIRSAEEFIEGLRPRTRREKALPLVLGAIAGMLVLALAAWLGLSQYYQSKVNAVEECIGAEACADAHVLAQRLSQLKPEDQARISEDRRDEIKGIFYASMARHWAPDQGRYDYADANKIVAIAFDLYGTDSAWVKELGDGLDADRDTRLSQLNDAFSEHIGKGAFVEGVPQGSPLLTVLDAVRAIDPTQALLKDGRIAPTIEAGIRASLENPELTPELQVAQAQNRLQLAQKYIGETVVFKTLEQEVAERQEQVEALAEEQRRLAEAAAQKEQRLMELDTALREADSTATWRTRVRDNFLAATEVTSKGDEAFKPLEDRLARTLLAQSQAAQKQNDLDSASEAARLGVELLPGNSALNTQFDVISAARDKLIAQAETEAERQRLNLARLDQLLTRPVPSSAWVGEVAKAFKTVESGTDAGELTSRRDRFSQGLTSLVNKTIEADEYSRAESLAIEGAKVAPDDAGIAALALTVADARRKAQSAQLQRLSQLSDQASYDKEWQRSVDSALDSLKGVSDPQLEQLKAKLATGYAERARALADEKNFVGARKMLDAGAEIAPKAPAVIAAGDRIGTLEKVDREQAKQQRIRFEVEALERTIELKANAAEISSAVSALRDLRKLEPNNDFASKTAPALISNGALKLAERFASRGDFKNAVNAADRGLAVLHTPELSNAKASYELNWCRTDLDRELRRAGSIGAGRKSQCLNQIKAEDRDLYRKYESLTAAPAPAPEPQPKPPAPAPAPAAKPEPAPQVALETPKFQAPRSDPCKSSYSGRGAKTRRQCFDKTADGRGPTMVVVAGRGTFAITQAEISKYDFSRYCRATRQCPPPAGDPYLPITGVTAAQAQGFAKWLSSVSGRRYRLPTESEWVHAATVGGRDVMAEGHCADPGAGPKQTTAGVMNKWGLVHTIGNVWELVSNGGTVMMVGGSYREDRGNCSASARRAFTGRDSAVGFRLVRELD